MRNAAITGWGMSVPERVLTNADLERMVETSDEWITSRTGIKERRIVGPSDSTTSLSVAAARQALDKAGLTAADIDLIVVATCTPDQFLVSQACLVQAELGGNAGAFDLGAACAGFVYALAVGSQFVQTGLHERVLVIGVDTLTRWRRQTRRAAYSRRCSGRMALATSTSTSPVGARSCRSRRSFSRSTAPTCT
jgi:3-oxoacyl-[acyl-carrier-protein] synthase-3